MKMTRTKWFLPAFCVALGGAVLAAQWIGGNLHGGLVSLALMSGFGLVILVGGRSETVRGLRGDGRDERFRTIDVRASAFAGFAVILALTIAWLVELARGQDGSPYGELMAVGGIAYLAAIAVLRWRG
jgi:Ni/Fe-hydrogenase subunit HybB-like protein